MPRVTILPDGKVVEVAAGTTLLEASNRAGAFHGAACGGVGACGKCHVWLREGGDSLSEAGDRELDQLDKVFDVKPSSRLGCLARVGHEPVTFEITPESTETWLDEHPAERHEIEAGRMPAGASEALLSRLAKHVRK
jgi:2Fe-2S ferredoxin